MLDRNHQNITILLCVYNSKSLHPQIKPKHLQWHLHKEIFTKSQISFSTLYIRKIHIFISVFELLHVWTLLHLHTPPVPDFDSETLKHFRVVHTLIVLKLLKPLKLQLCSLQKTYLKYFLVANYFLLQTDAFWNL